MATVLLSGTNVRLLSSVPFHSDYNHSRWFTSKESQQTYFLSKPVVWSANEANFQRLNNVSFMDVREPIENLLNVNYMMFQNAQYSNKWFYAFVTQVEYIQRNNTRIHFKIDVLHTWLFDMNFKPSYVIREHCPLWQGATPVINTIDEGLDYGDIYETVSVQQFRPFDDLLFMVVGMKEHRHSNPSQPLVNQIKANYLGMPQPLTYYVTPFKLSGAQPTITVGGSGAHLSTAILDVLSGMYRSEDAVNNIVTAYITDFIGNNSGIAYDSANNTVNFSPVQFEIANFRVEPESDSFTTLYLKQIREYEQIEHSFGGKYSGFEEVTESKLLMYPYALSVLDDFKGNRLEIKNEYINSPSITVTAMGSIGNSNKVSYGVKNYATKGLNENNLKKMVLEHSLINDDPNDIPVMNEHLAAFMQGNRNAITQQQRQIWFDAGVGTLSSMTNGIARGNLISSGISAAQSIGQGVLALQSIQAKISDINNKPPSLQQQGSNTAFSFGNRYTGVHLIKKQIRKEYRDILSDFFNMYGYKVNRVKIPNFRTRLNWNYVQTQNCVIRGNFNNEDLQELRNIFNNGITLWHTDDIGNYNLSNEVR